MHALCGTEGRNASNRADLCYDLLLYDEGFREEGPSMALPSVRRHQLIVAGRRRLLV